MRHNAETILMHTYRARRLIPLTCTILLVAAPSIWLARQHRQLTLNRDLIAAIKQSDAARVDSLLTAGADPNTRDTPVKNESALEWMNNLFHPQHTDLSPTALILSLDLQRDDNTLPPQTSAIVQSLLTKGANTEMTVPYGATPLMLAIMAGYDGSVRMLLDHGANTEATAQDGTTPLILACAFDRSRIVRMLLDRGANPNHFIASSRTSPLESAKVRGFQDIVSILKSRGAKE